MYCLFANFSTHSNNAYVDMLSFKPNFLASFPNKCIIYIKNMYPQLKYNEAIRYLYIRSQVLYYV